METFSLKEAFCAHLKQCCSLKTLKRKLPIMVWLPKYRCKDLQSDIIAGVTVGLTVIPQALAYGKIAGLPAYYGLYSAFMGCFVYCLLGTSKDITLGPTAIMSLMTASFASSPVHNDATYAIVLALMVGLVQFCMGVLNLGIIVNFISYPVITAFTSAAAIIIAIGQIKGILGLHDIPRETIPCIYHTFAQIRKTNIWDCVLGIVCLILIYLMKKLRTINWRDHNVDITRSQHYARKLLWFFGTAANAIVVISASLIVAVFDSQKLSSEITTAAGVETVLPPFSPPSFSLDNNGTIIGGTQILNDIGIGLMVVPLIGLVELIAIGNAFARKNNYRIDATQELIATGIANIMGSFISAYPITGSFSRTAINSQSGCRTPASGIFTGALVLLALGVLSPLFEYIPIATLSAMIIVAVIPMVDVWVLREMWRVQKIDILPWGVTFVLSFVIGIEYGILCGIGVSLLFILFRVARPRIHKSGRNMILMTLDNGLQYPAADYVTDKINELSSNDEACLVLDCRHIHAVDFTSIMAFRTMHADLYRKGIPLVLLAMRPHILDQLLKTGVDFKTSSTMEDARWICEESLEVSQQQSLIQK